MRGSLVAIVTPMSVDGSLDLAAWERLLDFHLAEGTQGIVIAGTTGESPSLTLEETEELTRRAVARCAGKIPLIVGAGTNSTASTVARTRALSRLGVGPAFPGEGGAALGGQLWGWYQAVIAGVHAQSQCFLRCASKKLKISSITSGCAQASVCIPPATGSQVALTPFTFAWSTMALLASNTMTVS